MAEPPIKRAKLDDEVETDGVDHDALTKLQDDLDRVRSVGHRQRRQPPHRLPLLWQLAGVGLQQRIMGACLHAYTYYPHRAIGAVSKASWPL